MGCPNSGCVSESGILYMFQLRSLAGLEAAKTFIDGITIHRSGEFANVQIRPGSPFAMEIPRRRAPAGHTGTDLAPQRSGNRFAPSTDTPDGYVQSVFFNAARPGPSAFDDLFCKRRRSQPGGMSHPPFSGFHQQLASTTARAHIESVPDRTDYLAH